MDKGDQMKKRLFVAGTAALVSLATAVPAFAHVTIQPNEALAESFARFVVRVPNERDDAGTIKVEVQFPPLAAVSFMDVPGWERTVKMQKLDEPIEAFGESLKEAVGTVTWSGGEIEPGEFMEFPFSALTPAGEEPLEFKAIQTYSGGEVVRWTGPEDADTPAPRLSLVELGDLGKDHGELGTLHEVVHELEETIGRVDTLQEQLAAAPDTSTTTTNTSEAEDAGDSNTLPLIVGGAGALLGLIALAVALSKRSA
jgi:uncharacterized protein